MVRDSGIVGLSAGRCALTLLVQALRELGGVLSAVDVPQGVKDGFPSLSDLQTHVPRLYSYLSLQVGRRTRSCALSQPTS